MSKFDPVMSGLCILSGVRLQDDSRQPRIGEFI